ncbi:MAG: DNA repair protein RecO [Pyrinomonadaceae bacterium]|nr:DNA repair protein RecO [Pyrinomonadaceae bacterium]MCX7640988.1 DNA repair protein RecO [Pyrinomonadaceae bacterium]MDW8305088.1 DNA repair protein RecO [Acidobacteriota bacterium]
MIEKTEGFVLRSSLLGEGDKLVECLTRDHGLLRGVARGARKLKSRFSGSLEMFSEVDIFFFRKEQRELVTFCNIDLRQSYFDFISKPENFTVFSYLANLILELVPEFEPDERFYRLVKACLEAAQNDSDLQCITFYFEFWILKLSGFIPSFENFNALTKRPCFGEETKEIFLKAQRLSPSEFATTVKGSSLAREISKGREVLRNLIVNVLEKDFFDE